MQDAITQILDESIRQELLVSDFYRLFETTFSDDRDFWYQLSKEELNHSTILQAEKNEFYESGLLPEELVPKDLQALKKQNLLLSGFFKKLKRFPPSVEQSFSIAICLEEAISETAFRLCLKAKPETRALKIFQMMVDEGRAHVERILQHAAELKISLEQASSLETLVDSLRHREVAKDGDRFR
jgi:hypothetical protein